MRESSTIDRRSLLAGVALTGAALTGAGLGAGQPRPAAAAAPMQGLLRPTHYRFPLGNFEVTTILDGAVQLDGPHPIFGQNATPEEVAELAERNFLPPGRMEIAFSVTVVNTGSEVILFDTGNGANGFVPRPGAGRMRALLAAAGIAPEQVDIVVLTHFHRDHIGGLMEADGPAFPNAAYVMPGAEYDFWSDAALVDHDALGATAQVVQSSVVPLADQARFVAGGDVVVSGIEAVASVGHTPGHISYHLESGGDRLLVLGDVSNHYVCSLQRPDWHVAFDMDKEQAVAARREVLGMIAADRIPFIGYHMPPPAVGYLEAMGDGFRFLPVSYQLHV